MLVVENNNMQYHWTRDDSVHPFTYGGEIIIYFDPSKKNMAMVIGTPTQKVLTIIEFSGNNRKRGPVEDTTLYCEEVRSFLGQFLRNAHIMYVATEQTILKKGANYYTSNKVLNEIRSNLLNFFLEQFNIHVIEVNNWSWKYKILPKGFRSQFEKGSKRYFQQYYPDSPYNDYFQADVTDCLCIYQYICLTECEGYQVFCNRAETPLSDYSYSIVPVNSSIGDGLEDVVFNNRFSLEENLAFYTNRLMNTFSMKLDVSEIPIDIIYAHSTCFAKEHIGDKEAKVIACRKRV